MDVPKQVMSVGMDLANAIKAKLSNGENVNTTAVVMTDDMGEWEINCSLCDYSREAENQEMNSFDFESNLFRLLP